MDINGVGSPSRPWVLADRKASAVKAMIFGSLALCLVTTVGCGSGSPSPDSGREALAAKLDMGSTARLRLLTFQKTDGRAMEFRGVKAYEMIFASEAEFVSNAMFSGGSPFASQGSEIVTAEYREPSPGFSWDSFLAGSQGFRPAMKGDRLHLAGSVTYEQRESGWVPIGVQFTVKHDETTRDMEAIRRADEQRQQEEAQRLRLAAERAEQLARERAAHDAAAESTSFVIKGPRDGYQSGTHWIGRLTSSDVLLFRPVRGELKQVTVYTSVSLVPDTHNHPPGDHVEDGHFGGGGESYDIAGDLRIEMPRLSRTRTEDIFVRLRGSGDVEVGVTILCHAVEGVPPCTGR